MFSSLNPLTEQNGLNVTPIVLQPVFCNKLALRDIAGLIQSSGPWIVFRQHR